MAIPAHWGPFRSCSERTGYLTVFSNSEQIAIMWSVFIQVRCRLTTYMPIMKLPPLLGRPKIASAVPGRLFGRLSTVALASRPLMDVEHLR